MQMPDAPETPITLEAAKNRLVRRLGISYSSVKRMRLPDRVKERGLYLDQQLTIDGGKRLRFFRVLPSVVDEIADEVLRNMPTASQG